MVNSTVVHGFFDENAVIVVEKVTIIVLNCKGAVLGTSFFFKNFNGSPCGFVVADST